MIALLKTGAPVVFDMNAQPGVVVAEGEQLRAHCPACYDEVRVHAMTEAVKDRFDIVKCQPPMLVDKRTGEITNLPGLPEGHPSPSDCRGCEGCRAAKAAIEEVVRRTLREEGWTP